MFETQKNPSILQVWKDRANDIKAGAALGILQLKSVKSQRAQMTYGPFKTMWYDVIPK